MRHNGGRGTVLNEILKTLDTKVNAIVMFICLNQRRGVRWIKTNEQHAGGALW
jgi:hypothetical protein